MADPLFPNVPDAPGVPQVLRELGVFDLPETALTVDSEEVDAQSQQWGVFDENGGIVIEPDSILRVEDGMEYRIADYPLERGAFESYNKTASPFEVRVTMAKGGGLQDRTQFLNDVKTLVPSLDLYSVVTPEEVFVNVNFEAARKTRSSDAGNGLIVVETILREIRLGVEIAFSSSREPSGADDVNDGSVQTTDAPSSILYENFLQ